MSGRMDAAAVTVGVWEEEFIPATPDQARPGKAREKGHNADKAATLPLHAVPTATLSFTLTVRGGLVLHTTCDTCGLPCLS